MRSLYFSNFSCKSAGVRRSLLFPNRILGIQLPQWFTNCCSQFLASLRESSFVRSNTITPALERVKQLQTIVRYLYCPAESHSSRLKLASKCETFLNRQSIPIVGFWGLNSPSTYLMRSVLLPTADLPMMMVLQFLSPVSSTQLIPSDFIFTKYELNDF